MAKSKLPPPHMGFHSQSQDDLTELGKGMGTAGISMVKGMLSGVPTWIIVGGGTVAFTMLGSGIWIVVLIIQALLAAS